MSGSVGRLTRKLALGSIPALALLVALEIVSLHYYFRDVRPEPLGIQAAANDIRQALALRFDPESVNKLGLPPNVKIFESLYTEDGEKLLAEFQSRYRESFLVLADHVRRIEADFLVVYIPPTVVHPLASLLAEVDSTFFRGLAEASGAGYLDMGPLLNEHALEEVALAPEDPHLSRFGNRVFAAAVGAELASRGVYRSRHRFNERPVLLGDLPPGTRRIWQDVNLPFKVTVNEQGLRMPVEVGPRGERQRILLLGDSYTFGYNAHDVATYPYFLAALLEDREIINAGVPGTTITQETEMFIERAQYAEPDIVVLQVSFNDLYGLFSFEQNIFSRDLRTRGFWFGKRMPGRERMTFEPSDLERRFVERLRAKHGA